MLEHECKRVTRASLDGALRTQSELTLQSQARTLRQPEQTAWERDCLGFLRRNAGEYCNTLRLQRPERWLRR